MAWQSLPLKLPTVQLDFLAIHEVTTDNLEKEAALKNFSVNKHFTLFPSVNKTVAFDIIIRMVSFMVPPSVKRL